ncbi:MAG: OmpA family protein [Gemmatimonadales bacterium]
MPFPEGVRADTPRYRLGPGRDPFPEWKLAIEGTDSIASDRFNLELSQRRAAAVKTALTGKYAIDAGRLTTAGYGESRPVDRNDTPEGRARNRRVELVRTR